MEITDVEASSTATSPSPSQRQEPRQSSLPPSIPSSRKRKSATKTTSNPKEKPSKEVTQRSWVWNHVSKCTIKEGKEVMKKGKMQKVEVEVLKAKCNYCGQLFACDPSGGGTSTYSKHILRVCKKYVRNDEIHQKVLGSSTSSISASGDINPLFFAKGWSQDESVVGIIEFIVIDEMPFGVVEKEGFRRMMNKVQPRLHVPSRRTIVREVFKMYDHLYADLRAELGKHRVSLTTDTWTSIQNVNYMVLTAHFVDDEWNMDKRIINFCPIVSHSGNQIGKLIEQCLVEWKIEKVMCISVDNALPNKVAIEWLVGKMLKWSNCQLLLEGKYMHVRCLAHILNLIVKDGLKKLNKSVTSIRNAVRFVRSSPRRFDYFKKCVEIEKLDNKGLVVMDVPTRWNSTYLMLESALKFRKAFDRMCEDEDNGYMSYFQEKEDVGFEGYDVVEGEVDKCRKGKVVVGPPTELDWENVQVFVSFLKVFYLITLKLSASKHPTSHTAVHDMIAVEFEILKLFLPSNVSFCSPSPRSNVEGVLRNMGESMRAKYQKYFGSIGSINQLFVVALVLDPRFKLRHYNHLLRKQLGCIEQEIEERSNAVKDLMKELCDSYTQLTVGPQKNEKNKVASIDTSYSSKSQRCSAPTETPLIFDEMMDDWEKELEDTQDVVLAHEVDRYLLDRLEVSNKREMFDILKWWKLKGVNAYPTLALVAKDVLAIQVSTVASESAFSTGGRVIDAFRSSLTPKSVETLICLQNWLRSEDISNIEYEASEAEIDFYQECEIEYQKSLETIASQKDKGKGVVIL